MKSLLNKRLPGILAVGLVALAVGAAGAPSSASTQGDTTQGATISALTPAQTKAKKRAIRKCKKIRNVKKRKACIRKVNKKYKRLSNQNPGTIPVSERKTVDVGDDYFAPFDLSVKVGAEINWVWNQNNGNAHNVTLVDGPSTLTATDKYNLSTPNSPSINYSFKRQLTKPGDYDFICTLHSTVMTMKIKVNN